MRIISGFFKGKKIFEPNDIKTRPLKDLTKESIFNILNHSKKFNVELKNSVILDLFSGVGSFGIECCLFQIGLTCCWIPSCWPECYTALGIIRR